MSLTNIRRYIRLTKLTSELLDLVDDGDIPFRAGEDLSYIPAKGQQLISDLLGTTEYKVDLKKAGKLKEYAQAGRLNEDSARLILSGAIFDAPVKKMTAVKVPYKKLKQYVPAHLAQQELETYILRALEYYSRHWEEGLEGQEPTEELER